MKNKNKGVRQQYSKEFKLEAVRLAEGRSVVEVARSLGITDKQLYRWRGSLAAEGPEAFRGAGKRTALEEENYRLRLENQRLRLEQEILKKAAAYFAKHLA
jgi:transposase